MSHTPKVDASEAIRALGITHPVRFVSKNLNNGLSPEWADELNGGTTQGRTESADTVALDWDALDYRQLMGDEPKYSDPAHIIAHELVHVRQIQDAGSFEAAARAYLAAGGTLASGQKAYEANPFEAQAFEMSTSLAPLVKVTR